MRVRVPGVQILLLLLVLMLLVLVIAVPPKASRAALRGPDLPVRAASAGADLAPILEHGFESER